MTNANDNRPAWYDAKLLAYTPFIRRKANRWCALYPGNGDPEDFIQDVMAEALRRGPTYNPQYAFSTWVLFVCRLILSRRKQRNEAKMRTGKHVSIEAAFSVSTPATQQTYAELSETLRRMSGTRDADIVVRLAMGEDMQEVGNDYGISKERVRQLKVRELARLREAMAEAA